MFNVVREYRAGPSGIPEPYVEINGLLRKVAFAALPGSQAAFLADPTLEVLYEGPRGTGKTKSVLADFCQHVGQGFGAEWKGLIVRRTHPQLRELIALAHSFIPVIFPGARFNEMKSTWTFPDGATLVLSQYDNVRLFADYLGHAYPYLCFEELTTWPDPDCYLSLFACSRSTVAGMPRKIRATTNPYGRGRMWVMQRFRLPIAPGKTLGPIIDDSIDSNGNLEPPRRAIHSYLAENLPLMMADPGYADRLRAGTSNNEAMALAWVEGRWDYAVGGIVSDIWKTHRNNIVVPKFNPPDHWRIFCAMDYGNSKPTSVQYYAIARGEDIEFDDGSALATIKGDYFLIGELYLWTGKANEGARLPVAETAKRIHKFEDDHGIAGRVRQRIADTTIFDEGDRPSIASDFAKLGLHWEPADKGPGSRVQGVVQVRKRLLATKRVDGIREQPGLFVVAENCQAGWMRTVPTLMADETNPDDADSDSEDHSWDAMRYGLRTDTRPSFGNRRRAVGM